MSSRAKGVARAESADRASRPTIGRLVDAVASLRARLAGAVVSAAGRLGSREGNRHRDVATASFKCIN